MRKLLWFLIFAVPCAAQYIDPQGPPKGQVNWPRVTGSGSPTSAGFTCTASNFGQPYTDKSGPHFWVCANSGGTPTWYQVDGSGTGPTIEHEGTDINQSIINLIDSSYTPPTGASKVNWVPNTLSGTWGAYVINPAASIQMNVTPPAGGNYVVLYPSTQTYGGSGYCPGWNAVTYTGYGVSFPNYSGLFTGGVCTNTLSNWVFADGSAWPGSYNPANVTAVYAVGISSVQNGVYTPPYTGQTYNGTAVFTCAGNSILNNKTVAGQANSLTSLTGATIASATCSESMTQNSSVGVQASSASLIVPLVALYVYTPDAPAPSNTALNIGPSLNYDRTKNLLTTAQGFPNILYPTPIAQLPPSNYATNGWLEWVIDGTSGTDCTVGGGTYQNLCYSNGGGGWNIYPRSSGGSGTVTSVATDTTSGISGGPITTTGTISCLQSSSTQFGCMKPDNSTITCTAGVCSASGGGGGGLSGQTVNYLPKATSATASTTSSAVEDQGSALVYHGTGTAHGLTMPEGTPVSGVAASDVLTSDATTHQWLKNPNGTGAQVLVGASTTAATSGHCAQFAANGYDITDAGAACGTGGGGGSGASVYLFQAGSNGAACNGSTDDTSALNTLLGTVNTAGGGTIQVAGTCLISGQITLPNSGASSYPTQATIRITGVSGGGTANGSPTTRTTAPAILDMRFNSTSGKILTLGTGKLEIDHLTLKDGGSDCASFLYTTNTTLSVHDNIFTGTASGTSACNDAIILGGTTTSYGGNTATAPFQGYGTYIEHNHFDNIRRGVFFRNAANGVVVNANIFEPSCGATTSEAAIQIGYSGGSQAQSNIFSGNLFETTNYPYVYAVWDANNLWYGDTFWDASATTQYLLWFSDPSTLGNVAYITHDASISASKLSNYQYASGTGNAVVMDQNTQMGLGIAAANGKLCADSSGSGTAQSCTTFVSFTPTTGSSIIYTTTTGNTGTGLTINVNGGGAKSVYKCNGSTATLGIGDIPANKPVPMYLDAAGHWDVISTVSGCGGGTTTNALTMNNSGTGDVSGSTFNGSAAKTISYNTIGAAPTASPTFTGTVTMPAPTMNNVTGSTQCLHVNSSGVVSGTGADCGTSSSTAVQINGGSALGTLNITGDTTQACADSSGSGTAQVCNTSTSFTPFTNACVVYTTTTTNSGTGLTVNVNSLGAKSVAIPGSSGWTTTLTASIIPANKPMPMCYDGTNWNLMQTGTVAAGGSGAITNITGSATWTTTGGTGAVSGGQYATTSGSVSKISITSIPSTYLELQLKCRGAGSFAFDLINMTLNNDTTTDYGWQGHYTQNNTSTNTGYGGVSNSSFRAGFLTTLASYFFLDIPGYNQAVVQTGRNESTIITSVSSAANDATYQGGFAWSPGTPAAVNRIDFSPVNGTINSGFSCTLYGLN